MGFDRGPSLDHEGVDFGLGLQDGVRGVLAEVADQLRVGGHLERARVREVLEVVRNGERTSSFCSAASASASNFWDSAGRASNHAFCFEFIIHTVSTSSSTRRRLVVGAYARNEVLLRDEVADHGRPV